MTKFMNQKMKIKNESTKFLEGKPDVDVMLEAGRGKKSMDINEISSDSSDTSWLTVRTTSGQISQPLVYLG